MHATAMAVMILFAGKDLDGWQTIAGGWTVQDKSMVCSAGPASIRSTCESDRYVLTFQYRRADRGRNRLAVHSKLTTGGPILWLTPAGVTAAGAPDERALSRDEWISVRVDTTSGGVRAQATGSDGRPLGAVDLAAAPDARGFIRFETGEPGLEIRDVRLAEPGFTPMVDGRTLDDWEIVAPKDFDDPGWVIEQGVIRCRGRRSSWLRTLRTYNSFILRLEYELPPRGNSGIFLRAPIEGRVSREGLEVQLLDDLPDRGWIKPAQHNGSVYDGIAPELAVPAPPDQFNAIEILLDGKRIRTTLNGTTLYDARLDDASKDTNSHERPLATRRVVGFLGLQDHATTVRFRNIRIRELP